MKELEDYKWFPAILRRWQMDFIGSLVVWMRLYNPIVPVLQQIVEETKCNVIQDVCSGSGQSAIYVQQKIISKLQLVLSDKYPDAKLTTIAINYVKDPVDIMELKPQKSICYTMYNAFHHFNSVVQNQIVQNMATANAPFLFVEILQPSIISLIKIFFTTTILQLLTAPFIKPFSIARLFFTYIIPVNLFTITYDGLVSVLKSKTAVEFTAQFSNLDCNTYNITVHTAKSALVTIVYIKGQPITI